MALFFLRTLLGFLLLASGKGELHRPGNFRVIGPGGGGAMFHPTVSPHDLNTILVNCDMTGAYISHDGGKSWRMFNLRGVVEFFVFDPSDENVIYAQATGLWRSQDQGETWNLVYPKPSSIKGVRMSSDHSDEDIVAEPNPLGGITAMAVDPAASNIFYVTAGDRRKGASSLFVSRDGGQSWNKEEDLPELARRVWVNPSSPADKRMLLLAGPHFIVEKTPSGVKKIPIPSSKNITDISAGFTKDGRPLIYTIGDETAFVSDDEGANWRKVNLGPGNARLRAIATSLHNPDTAYVSYNNLEEGGVKWLGVAKTTDVGRTWSLVWKEDSNPAAKSGANIHDAWITERFGTDWGENPLALTVADQDANVAIGTDLGRTMLTTDGGANWVALYSRKSEGSGWVSTGLDVTTTYGYHFDPFDSNRQFISTTDIGLFRSEDGGKSWVS